jgi:hypothetical protein
MKKSSSPTKPGSRQAVGDQLEQSYSDSDAQNKFLAGVTLTHFTLSRCRNVFNNLEKPSHTASALFTLA